MLNNVGLHAWEINKFQISKIDKFGGNEGLGVTIIVWKGEGGDPVVEEESRVSFNQHNPEPLEVPNDIHLLLASAPGQSLKDNPFK